MARRDEGDIPRRSSAEEAVVTEFVVKPSQQFLKFICNHIFGYLGWIEF